jgi:N-acetylglucosamine-6-phosphate deacetylase
MTLSAAEILGVADRTGTIEAGKMANLAGQRRPFGRDKFVPQIIVTARSLSRKNP